MNENNLDQKIELLEFWNVIKKRKWIIFIIFAIVTTYVSISTFKKRPVYQTAARILIDKQYPNVVSFKEVLRLSANRNDYYESQYKILKSKTLVRRVIDELDLQNSPEFLPGPVKKSWFNFSLPLQDVKSWLSYLATPADQEAEIIEVPSKKEIETNKKNRLVYSVLGGLKIIPVKKSRLVDISYKGRNPKVITKIVNTLARTYISYNLEVRLDASGEAEMWLSERLKTLKEKVNKSQVALQRYKEKVKIVSFEEKQNIVDQRLLQLNTEVTLAKTKRIKIESIYKPLKGKSKDFSLLESLPSIISNQLIQKLKMDLAERQEEYSMLSKKYGPRHPRIKQILSQLETMEEKINYEIKNIYRGISMQYQAALAEEKALMEALDNQKKEVSIRFKKAIKFEALKREAESDEQMYTRLLKRLKETGLSSGLRNNNIRIIDLADVPQNPIGPGKGRSITVAIFFGLFLGVLFAFFVEYLDDTVKDPEEIPLRFQVAFLGLLGRFSGNSKKAAKHSAHSKLIAIHDPTSNISESLRTVRTNVIFCSNEKKQKTIMITSAVPSEGKSTLSSNLAIVMASLGEKVLLIDADLRKPVLHKLFNLKKSPGLSNYLIGQQNMKEIIEETSVKGLCIIPSGPTPPNPSELLSSPRFKMLCDTAGDSFDRIILDSPPVASVSDPLIVSSMVDSVIMVIRCGKTSRDSISKSVRQLKNIQANIIGMVLNDVDFRKDSYYYQYYYKHYYYKEGKKA